MSHTFLVDPKPVSDWRLKAPHVPVPFQEAHKLPGETLYGAPLKTIGGKSTFFDAVGLAFNEHFPLVLTPDAVWLTILTGLVHHIDADPEGLRHHFVTHADKIELEFKSAGSMRTLSNETWDYAIRTFSDKIGEHVGKRRDLILCDFSTTTPTDRLSSEIALMGAMKHFFTYKMHLCCGLTKVTVEGTPEDWGRIRDRVRVLSEFDLKWWTDHLEPVIDQFIKASEGSPDLDFWRAIYLAHRFGSGGQFNVSGWVNTFFPYIAGRGAMARNQFVDWQASKGDGNETVDFPSGLVSAPVAMNDNGRLHDLMFYGGLVAVNQAEDLTVKPVSGFSIQLI